MYISMQLKLLFNETRKTRPGKLEKNCLWFKRVYCLELGTAVIYYAVSAEGRTCLVSTDTQQSAVLTRKN